MKPTCKIILDDRKPVISKGPDVYSIKLRATFPIPGKRSTEVFYPLGHYCTKGEFPFVTGEKKQERGKLKQHIAEAKEAYITAEFKKNEILKADTVTREQFERLFLQKAKFKSVDSVFMLKIDEEFKNDKIGNRDCYENARSALARFAPGVTFPEITKDFLMKFEKYLLAPHPVDIKSPKTKKVLRTEMRTCKRSTIGFYMRHLMAVYNMAVALKYVSKELYPFGKYAYKIKQSGKRKIALQRDEKNSLLGFLSKDAGIMYAVDFWRFSYFCDGLNMTDIAHLKRGEIDGDVLTHTRKKVENSSGEELVITLREEVQEIIARRGAHDLAPDAYVFPILSPGMTATEQKKRIKHFFIKKVNKGLKKACTLLDLPLVKLTTYTARHTFATIALKNGASLEYIQQALGHTEMRTTKRYTNGLDLDTKRAQTAKL